MNHTESGALVGTTLGTVAGAVIGHQAGNAAAGALIGAGTGAVVGGLAGNAEDAREERDAALAYQQAQFNAQLALTNADVIGMAQNGVGDQVIIGAIRNRGGRFDLSPQSIIDLKQRGVSDAVIAYMQSNTGGLPNGAVAVVPPVYPRRVYVAPPGPDVVIVGRPWGFGWHGHWGRHHHHHHHDCW
jgi:hypothetical protein